MVDKAKQKTLDAADLARACANLAELARSKGFELGTYLLEMAVLEFANQQKESGSVRCRADG